MLTTPFLTELDSRAAIKGSRDPLGIQFIWTHLGREVIGNLTTVSNSVPDFVVLLTGFHFVEAVAESLGSEHDLATFLKWEQIAAYARGVTGNFQFRGSERARQRLNDKQPLRIGADREAQILADQKTYGLWGLYTVPAKSSGLIAGEPARLSAIARDWARVEVLPQIDRHAQRCVARITSILHDREYEFSTGKQADRQLLEAIGTTVVKPGPQARALFRETLLHGGKSASESKGRQQLLAGLLHETLADDSWRVSPASIRELSRRAAKCGEVGESLAERLARICAAESVLAPAAALFQFLLGCDGQDVERVAKKLESHWSRVFGKTIPRRDVEAWIAEMKGWHHSPDMPGRWLLLAEALHGGSYREAINLILEQNADVMQSRAASAPWAIVTDGKLDIRFKDDSAERLPEGKEIPGLWRHAYFIQSLRDVAAFLETA